MTQEEVEALIAAKIESGEAETGLYKTGLQYVVVDRISDGKNDRITFEWFSDLLTVDDLVNT